jgi:hypothetical protein
MSAAQVLEMALYDPNEKDEAMISLTFRVPKSLVQQMDASVRLRRSKAKAKNEETRGIDRSFVMRTYLREGWEHDFDEYGGMPTDEAGWAEVEAKIIAKVLKAAKKSR